MSYTFVSDNSADVDTSGAKSDLCPKCMTTAGVLVGAGTGVAGAGLCSCMPGQMTVAATPTGGLLCRTSSVRGQADYPGMSDDKSDAKRASRAKAKGDTDITTDTVVDVNAVASDLFPG